LQKQPPGFCGLCGAQEVGLFDAPVGHVRLLQAVACCSVTQRLLMQRPEVQSVLLLQTAPTGRRLEQTSPWLFGPGTQTWPWPQHWTVLPLVQVVVVPAGQQVLLITVPAQHWPLTTWPFGQHCPLMQVFPAPQQFAPQTVPLQHCPFGSTWPLAQQPVFVQVWAPVQQNVPFGVRHGFEQHTPLRQNCPLGHGVLQAPQAVGLLMSLQVLPPPREFGQQAIGEPGAPGRQSALFAQAPPMPDRHVPFWHTPPVPHWSLTVQFWHTPLTM